MRFALGSDERNAVADLVLAELRARGHEIVQVVGPAGESAERWADCGRLVGEAVARGARRWNDANVLALSLQLTDQVRAAEILDAWLDPVEVDPAGLADIRKLDAT